MLPQVFELPAALFLVLGGMLACVAGFRLFRLVLVVYGFILGAMMASSMMGATNTTGMLVAALAGGIVGALVMMFAYFVGIALVGAGSAVFLAHAVWRPLMGAAEPPAVAVVVAAVVGAIAAMLLARYVIIVATAFGGAWTAIVGALAAAAGRLGPLKGATADAWILYPLNPAPGTRWVPYAWVALGVAGAVVQLAVTARKR